MKLIITLAVLILLTMGTPWPHGWNPAEHTVVLSGAESGVIHKTIVFAMTNVYEDRTIVVYVASDEMPFRAVVMKFFDELCSVWIDHATLEPGKFTFSPLKAWKENADWAKETDSTNEKCKKIHLMRT